MLSDLPRRRVLSGQFRKIALVALAIVSLGIPGLCAAQAAPPEPNDYTVCAKFGPTGPDESAQPPISRPPRLVNGPQIVGLAETYGKERGISGMSHVWFLVDSDGILRDVRLRRTSGNVEVDTAALTVAKRMKFRPADLNEKPVCTWVAWPVKIG